MRARANACNVNEIRKALDEKEKQVASMLTERDMQQDELVRVSAQILGNSSFCILFKLCDNSFRITSTIYYRSEGNFKCSGFSNLSQLLLTVHNRPVCNQIRVNDVFHLCDPSEFVFKKTIPRKQLQFLSKPLVKKS